MFSIREFSEKEKQQIRKRLIEYAKNAFSKAGIKKTSIEELTKSVGIAKGSFYIFFKSKEELYFELLMEEIANSFYLDNSMTKETRVPFRQQLRDFLQKAVSSVKTNPIIKLMLIPEEYNIVQRRITADSENNSAMDIIAPLTVLIKQWQSEGAIVEVDAYLLASVIKCLFLLTIHEDEIGDTIFTNTMNYFIDMIVDNFTRTNESENLYKED